MCLMLIIKMQIMKNILHRMKNVKVWDPGYLKIICYVFNV